MLHFLGPLHLGEHQGELFLYFSSDISCFEDIHSKGDLQTDPYSENPIMSGSPYFYNENHLSYKSTQSNSHTGWGILSNNWAHIGQLLSS